MIEQIDFDQLFPDAPKEDRAALTLTQWNIRNARTKVNLAPLRRCFVDWEENIAFPLLLAKGFDYHEQRNWWTRESHDENMITRYVVMVDVSGQIVHIFYDLPKAVDLSSTKPNRSIARRN